MLGAKRGVSARVNTCVGESVAWLDQTNVLNESPL